MFQLHCLRYCNNNRVIAIQPMPPTAHPVTEVMHIYKHVNMHELKIIATVSERHLAQKMNIIK